MAHPLALPKTFSPDALDATAELAAILARLRPPQSTGAGGVSSGATPQPAATTAGVAAAAGGGAAAAGGDGTAGGDDTLGGPKAGPPINLRDLPTATDGIRHKLQHARAQIKTLPDIGRTVAAQETEIRQLEARIEAQRAMLARLRADGARFAAADGQQEPPQQQPDAVKMEL